MPINHSISPWFDVLLRMGVMAITIGVLCGFSTRALAQTECPFKTPEIFYLNGVDTDIIAAGRARRTLEKLFPNRKITTAQVNTDGFLLDHLLRPA